MAWRSERREDGEPGAGLRLAAAPWPAPAAASRASLVTIAANPEAAVFAFTFLPQFLPGTQPARARRPRPPPCRP